MRRGRRPVRHHEVQSLRRQADLTKPLAMLDAAIDGWLRGGPLSEAEAAIDGIAADLAAFRAIGSGQSDFTRGDQIVWNAVLYREAAVIAAKLTDMAQAASSHRDEKLADLVKAHVTPAEIPAYGVNFVKSLIAAGAEQADLHPATKRRADAVMTTLRSMQAAAVDHDAAHPEPPVRDWSELPETFAGYRLEIVDRASLIGPPAPLPVSPDIAAFTVDRLHPGEMQSRRDTYSAWAEIVEAWDAKRVAAANSNEVCPLNAPTLRAWVLLLGHRLDAPDTEPSDVSDLRIVSPWNSEQVIRPVWIGR